MATRPGRFWRILATKPDGTRVSLRSKAAGRRIWPLAEPIVADDSVFDELVIDDWLHIEQMDTRDWWGRIGDVTIRIHIPRRGRPRVRIEND